MTRICTYSSFIDNRNGSLEDGTDALHFARTTPVVEVIDQGAGYSGSQPELDPKGKSEG